MSSFGRGVTLFLCYACTTPFTAPRREAPGRIDTSLVKPVMLPFISCVTRYRRDTRYMQGTNMSVNVKTFGYSYLYLSDLYISG